MRLTGKHILQAFADCQHPKEDRVSLNKDGVPTLGGLVVCAHCGAHKRGRNWAVPYLVSCAITVANNMATKPPRT